jgi:hypothetical protein
MKGWLIHGGTLEDQGSDLVLCLTAGECGSLRHALESSWPPMARVHTTNGFKVTLRVVTTNLPRLIRTDDHIEILVGSAEDLCQRLSPLCQANSSVEKLQIDLDNDSPSKFVLKRSDEVPAE